MFTRIRMRRAAGCALAIALAGLPIAVATIELGSPMIAAPSRFANVDDLPGLIPAPADWAFAPACFGEFWLGMDLAADWMKTVRLAVADPFAGLPDGVSIILSSRPPTRSGPEGDTGAQPGRRSGSDISGPIFAGLLASASRDTGGGGSVGGGGSTGGGGSAGGGSEPPGGGIEVLLPPATIPPPEGEPHAVPPTSLPEGGGQGGGATDPVAAVPLPAGAPLLITSVLALGLLRRRRLLFLLRPRAACSE